MNSSFTTNDTALINGSFDWPKLENGRPSLPRVDRVISLFIIFIAFGLMNN